tara:strand:- start:1818 stop:2900 length:1083 start_codon:yes stop_codon:yes gene_type:complete
MTESGDLFETLDKEQSTSPSERYIEYDIATYPSDFTLEVMVDMWRNDDIVIPKFQRNFTWTIEQSSRLIESFLMGLPVPPIFLYFDEENKGLIIDGQQRIRSIVDFFNGRHHAAGNDSATIPFKLRGISEGSPFQDLSYTDLSPSHQRKLRSSVLRAINVRQLKPDEDRLSMFHIFERLNSGGLPLKSQEIRNAVYHGAFIDQLRELNKNRDWRSILKKKSLDKYQRDVELLLRIFALAYQPNYEKPLQEFLNKQIRRHRRANTPEAHEFFRLMPRLLVTIEQALNHKAFRVKGRFKVAAMDAMFAALLRLQHVPSAEEFLAIHNRLIESDEFGEFIEKATSDEASVQNRIRIALEAFRT